MSDADRQSPERADGGAMAGGLPVDGLLVSGELKLDLARGRAWLGHTRLALGGRAFALLKLLMYRAQHDVAKTQIIDQVWHGAAVSDSVLTTAVREIRQALNDNARNPDYIQTVHGSGYKFIRPVQRQAAAPDDPPLAQGQSPQPQSPQPQPVERGGRRRVVLAVAVSTTIVAAVLFVILHYNTERNEALRRIAALFDEPAQPAKPARTAVAVLPFVAMSDGPEDEYFADGLTEEILNSLAALPGLKVTARTSSFQYKGRTTPVEQIGQELGVRYVVEGSVRRAENELRIIAQLVRVDNQFHVWSKAYDAADDTVIHTQKDIAENIATALGVLLSDDQRTRMRRIGARNVDAFIAYQKGVELFERAHTDLPTSLDDLRAANVFFGQATGHDDAFLDPHIRRLDYYLHALHSNASARTPLYTDEQAAVIAADLRQAVAETLARADDPPLRAAIQSIEILVSDNWRGLRERLETALTMTPYDEEVLWFSTPAMLWQPTQLEKLAMRAFDISRRNSWPLYLAGRSAHFRGDHQREADLLALGLEQWPDADGLRALAVFSQLHMGRTDEARRLAKPIRSARYLKLVTHNILLAEGRVVEAAAISDDYRQTIGDNLQFLLAHLGVRGERALSNELAAVVDSRPAGPFTLLTAIELCGCDPMFDLAVTPNLAARLNDAGLPWPPRPLASAVGQGPVPPPFHEASQ